MLYFLELMKYLKRMAMPLRKILKKPYYFTLSLSKEENIKMKILCKICYLRHRVDEPKAIKNSDYLFSEHHIICFANTLHNTIINSLNKISELDILE